MSLRYYRICAEGMHSNEWGGDPTFWLEIDARGDAARQIEVYPNGRVLVYGPEHREDEHGALSIMVVEQGDDAWWKPHVITAPEFEAAWSSHRPANR